MFGSTSAEPVQSIPSRNHAEQAAQVRESPHLDHQSKCNPTRLFLSWHGLGLKANGTIPFRAISALRGRESHFYRPWAKRGPLEIYCDVIALVNLLFCAEEMSSEPHRDLISLSVENIVS
jgi:hypothetical protein